MISEHDRQLLSRLPVWNPTGDVVAQRRAWEELATVYNQDLPSAVSNKTSSCARAFVPTSRCPRVPVDIWWSSTCTAVDGRSAAQPPIASGGCSLPKRVI